MKLNKPPVTEEQSMLEEYVDFLLQDTSNVHQLNVAPSNNNPTDISQVIARQQSAQSAAPTEVVQNKRSENKSAKTKTRKDKPAENKPTKSKSAESKSISPKIETVSTKKVPVKKAVVAPPLEQRKLDEKINADKSIQNNSDATKTSKTLNQSKAVNKSDVVEQSDALEKRDTVKNADIMKYDASSSHEKSVEPSRAQLKSDSVLDKALAHFDQQVVQQKVQQSELAKQNQSQHATQTAAQRNLKAEVPANKNKLQASKSLPAVQSEPRKKSIAPVVEESEEAMQIAWEALLEKEKATQQVADKPITQAFAKTSIDNKKTAQLTASEPVSVEKIQPTENSAKPQPRSIEEAINEYLPKEKDQRLANVEKLLSRISLATMPAPKINNTTQSLHEAKVDTQENTQSATKVQSTPQVQAEAEKATFIQRQVQRNKEILPDIFQTLIFQVAKLPLAVPLLKLGGITKITQQDITPLVGTPDWFLGLVPNERGNLMVVDTQKYLMPEQSSVVADDTYQYLIILDDSNWALACHSVGDAKNLTQDDIRWSEKSSKRPWFAGMVVEFMSALLEVDELINMLADNIVDK
ncbi:chemotaxis protein CheW [Aliikangiella maris]|uniref:Chemotaxis protein CheW n=2 Tax=Aliikangiella maris TaxID=3162458 RepID=A0ABV3MMV6_9GAMM